MASRGLKPDAMLGVLASFAPTSRGDIAGIDVPTLVVSGARDHDNGSAQALAGLLPNGRAVIVNGDHMSAVGDPGLTTAITDWLG